MKREDTLQKGAEFPKKSPDGPIGPSGDTQSAEPAVSINQAAELMNVGSGTIKCARTVLNQGVPELVKAVEAGEVSVAAAAAVAKQPKEQQREIVMRGEKERRRW